ncbi:MAG TPA: hypothetical protein VLB68_11965 [Pyrinomonadaceae bacterium]|nr:hypothetical protein [Pyrinomonadaceae bacterium]
MSETRALQERQKLDHERQSFDASKISATLSEFLTPADFIRTLRL